MPPKIRPADERLIAAYREAALRINRTLADLTPRNKRVILRRIDIILGELDRMSAEYVQQALPLHYRDGSDEAVRQLQNLRGFSDEIDETFGSIHREAMKALADDAKLKFANALEGVRRSSQSLISRELKQKIIGQLLVSEIEGAANPAGRVQEVLEQEGIVAIQGRNRNWTLEDYSAMLTHTVLADAHNTGSATRYVANGIQFARVIERADAPDRTCQWMGGKVVFLGDRRLLNPYHPNCMGGLSPVFGEQPDAIMSLDDSRIPGDVLEMLLKKS